MSLLMPGAGTIDLALQVETLVQHMAEALNAMHQALMLLMDETSQVRKVVL